MHYENSLKRETIKKSLFEKQSDRINSFNIGTYSIDYDTVLLKTVNLGAKGMD